MDAAVDAEGNPVTVDQVRGLAVLPDLWCSGELLDGSECGAKVWATSLHSTKRAASFAAHHGEGCDEGSERSKDRPGDAGYANGADAGYGSGLVNRQESMSDQPVRPEVHRAPG